MSSKIFLQNPACSSVVVNNSGCKEDSSCYNHCSPAAPQELAAYTCNIVTQQLLETTMIDKERAKLLLGSGLGPADVAQTLGCEPQYLTELLQDEQFRTAVLALRIESLQSYTKRDRKIDAIEDTLIEKLEESVKWLMKPRDIIGAFNIINRATRRGAQVQGGAINITNNIVQLNLSGVARKLFTTNGMGEVVQVDDQPTVTMPLQQLIKQTLTQPQRQQGHREQQKQVTYEPVKQTIFDGKTFSEAEYERVAQAAGI